jgi:hypothetical protein
VTEGTAVGTPTFAHDLSGLRDSARASGGVLTDADPTTLGVVLADMLPSLMSGQFKSMLVYAEGVVPWDDVVGRVLAVGQEASGDR